MKILRININSFGNVKGWTSGDLSENVTLFTGANETGKTTTMEFIRNTLFPSRKSKYPSADRNDSGTLVIVMDDGDERMLVRKGRKVTEAKGKPLPSDELNIDAETYRSIFAMDLEQVANSKILTSGDFRNRFLTVPGGEEIPRISEDIEKRMLEIMNRSRISDRNELGSLLSEIDGIEGEIAAIEAKSDEYDKLVAERNELSRNLAGTKKKQELRRNEEGRNMVIMSQKKNVESLKELYRRREDLEYSREMPENAREEYNKLEMRLAATRIIDIDTSPEELPEALNGRKPKEILERQEDIENAWAVRLKVEVKEQMRTTLEETAESSQQLVEDYTQATGWSEKAARRVRSGTYISNMAESAIMARKSENAVPVVKNLTRGIITGAGLILLMLSLLLFPESPDLRFVLLLAGAVTIIIGLLLPVILAGRVERKNSEAMTEDEWYRWITSEGYPAKTSPEKACTLASRLEFITIAAEKRDEALAQIRMLNDEIVSLRTSVMPLFEDLKLTEPDFHDNAYAMYKLLKIARGTSFSTEDRDRRLEEQRTVEIAMTNFLADYGDRERFLAIWEDRDTLKKTDAEIEYLEGSMSASAGLEIGELIKLVEAEGNILSNDDTDDTMEELNRKIGELDRNLNVLMKDDAMSDLNARRTDAQKTLDDLVREWGTLSLAEHLISGASEHFYKDLQPSVVKTANRYLSLMTNGRYRLDGDPRDKDLFITDDREKKSALQWSSGLGDQVYLSVKMAVAKEMGSEKLPLILDDVLLRFDTTRKQGACKAILDFARDQQVILFSCDNSLYSLFSLEGRVNHIRLG